MGSKLDLDRFVDDVRRASRAFDLDAARAVFREANDRFESSP